MALTPATLLIVGGIAVVLVVVVSLMIWFKSMRDQAIHQSNMEIRPINCMPPKPKARTPAVPPSRRPPTSRV